jgi:hypothetical protein
MDQKTKDVILAGAALIGGAAVGGLIGKVVLEKMPDSEPVLIWASGALIGASVATFMAPWLIDKSTAARILASD